VLDIDAGSKYHNLKSLGKIRQCLADAGLKSTVLYRSSLSDGWHLYIFFDELISSRDLRKQLVLLFRLNDFQTEKGQLEVFPAPGDGPCSLGHGLRLPLQPGFAWLDPYDLEVIRDRLQLSPVKALEFFLQDLHDAPNTWCDFNQLKDYVENAAAGKEQLLRQISRPETNVIPIRPELMQQDIHLIAQAETVFGVLPPGMDAETWLKGRHYHLQGLTGPSQRADAIFCLNHYLFYGDPQRKLPALGYGYAKERRWTVERVLINSHSGHSKDINKGRPDALAQIERAAEWLPPERRHTEPLRFEPALVPLVWIRANENREQDARNRIQSALDGVKKLHRAFTTVELHEAAGCSRRTLYAHQDIWRDVYESRKDYRDLACGFFANCTGEYNVVVGAAASNSLPPDHSAQNLTPPGLLACRQISSELSMRSERKKLKQEKAAKEKQLIDEDGWRARVAAALTQANPSTAELVTLRTVLSLLIYYLATAPSEEDAICLQGEIATLRIRIDRGYASPLRLVGKPPPGG
jgi:hypothetical protein